MYVVYEWGFKRVRFWVGEFFGEWKVFSLIFRIRKIIFFDLVLFCLILEKCFYRDLKREGDKFRGREGLGRGRERNWDLEIEEVRERFKEREIEI